MPPCHHSARLSVIVGIVLLGALSFDSPARSNPTLGFLEAFPPANGVGTWGRGANVSNPGSGGVGGAGDGYLLVATTTNANLGANSFGPEYTGNWTAAGIDEVHLWLNDVGADENLEIHFLIGNGNTNFWSYNAGFLPPNHAWAEFVVPLTGPSGWTQTRGTGTFAAALQNVDRILVRHDRAPFLASPDPILGDFGLDRILLTNHTVTPTRVSSWGRIQSLYR